ncbi:hypothetical protein HDK64DRAFT_559 [Phyllosticta capitalensis]
MIFRRFTNVRIRLILRQQFEIRKLERELQILDQRDERDNIEALISQESDTNKDRERTLNLLKVALAEYDDLLQRNQWAMRVLEPTNNHVESTRNEFANLIVRSEAYFADGDFIDVGGATDPKLGRLYHFSENLAISSLALWSGLVERMQRRRLIKKSDPGTMQGPLFRKIARTIAASLSILMLLLPMIILNFVSTAGVRLAVVSVFSMVFISALTALSAAGTMEIFLAGAAYAAVLVVYVSQSGDGN